MKTVLLSFLSLLLITCNQDPSAKYEVLYSDSNNITITDNAEILGSWTMCSSFGNRMMTQLNVCPTISFLINGSGFVGNSSLSADRFTWTLEKGKLNILPSVKTSNATFSDTFYFAKIATENNLRELVISATKNNSQFFLSK